MNCKAFSLGYGIYDNVKKSRTFAENIRGLAWAARKNYFHVGAKTILLIFIALETCFYTGCPIKHIPFCFLYFY